MMMMMTMRGFVAVVVLSAAVAAVALPNSQELVADLQRLESDIAAIKSENKDTVGDGAADQQAMLAVEKPPELAGGEVSHAEIDKWLSDHRYLTKANVEKQKYTEYDKRFFRTLGGLTPEVVLAKIKDYDYGKQEILALAADRTLTPSSAEATKLRMAIFQDHANDKVDLSPEYIRYIASLDNTDFTAWYEALSSEQRDAFSSKMQRSGHRILQDSFDSFLDRYTEAQEAHNANIVFNNLRYKSLEAITQYMADLIDRYGDDKAIAEIIKYYRLLVVAEPKSNDTEARYRRALQDLMFRTKRIGLKSVNLISLPTVAYNAQFMEGPGSARVKASLIQMMFDVLKNPPPATLVYGLIKTDPVGVTRFLSGESTNSLKYLSKSIETIAKGAKDPQEASDEFSNLLAPLAANLATIMFGEIGTVDKSNKFHAAATQFGIMLETFKFGIKVASDVVRKAIEDGAFILKVFTKALSIAIPEIGKKIEEYANKAIDYEANREKKGVDKLEQSIKAGFNVFLDQALRAKGKSLTAEERISRRDQFLGGFEAGIKFAQDNDGKD